MSTDEIYARLSEIMADVFDVDDIVARPDMTADDVEQWDSLGHLRFVLAIQNAFKVKFAAAEVAAVRNVGELVALIQSRLDRA